MHHLDPNSLSIADRYKLLIGAIVPRPIAFVSTISPDGRHNLAPFSFFAGVSSVPPTLLFCPANKDDGGMKDTLRNILAGVRDQRATTIDDFEAGEGAVHADASGNAESARAPGEFVVNIVPHAIARQMAACAENLPYGESEFDLSGLTTAPSHAVRPARVAESPISFECRAQKVVRLAPGAPSGGNIVIGRIVWIQAMPGLVNERHHVDPALLDAIGRMGGQSYCTTRDRFDVPMGRRALEGP